MSSQSFVDHVSLYLRSGKGGAGAVTWRREKYVSKGGPDGGDGGKGGDIVLEGSAQFWTLLDLRYRKHIFAPNGKPGQGSRKTGKSGKDEILKVPLGTIVKDYETGEFLGEVKKDKERLIVLKGGQGGLGNWHFKSSTNQTPQYAQQGEASEERHVVLELKVLADVGLVGFPNAGKSTLLSVMTAATPKIGAYPFTTLVPNLGIVRYRDFRSFVMADIPGIIEDAHKGKGLGYQFLRHIERNSVLLFLVPVDADDIKAEYETLLKELEAYNPALLSKKKLLAVSKCDMLGPEELKELEEGHLPDTVPHILISSVTQYGLAELKDRLWDMLNFGHKEEEVENWWDLD